MTDSFFTCPPMNDPEQDIEWYCDVEDCAGYPTRAEHTAVREGGIALSSVLQDVIDEYSADHPELTYDIILHAISCLTFCIKADRDEEPDDA